ncbi:MAG: ABC transporter permease [Salibacteraceae bacterium]
MTRIIIKPRKFTPLSFRELGEYKELFWSLAFRDFKVRYAQTSIGIAWALLQPLISLLILNLVFGKFAKVDTNGLPHILYASSGMACWTYFSFVLTNTGNSIISSQQMLKKIYFPRIIVPVSKSIVGLIDFGIALGIIAGLMVYYQITPSSNIIFLPFFILINIMGALGIGIWISALTIRYRDFKYIVPFMVQIGLYITPVAFPSKYAMDMLPDGLLHLYFLNPAAGIIDGFRWCLFNNTPINGLVVLSLISALFFFITGVIYFQRVENKIADIV